MNMMFGCHFVVFLLVLNQVAALPLDLVFSNWDATVGRCPSLYGPSEKPGLLGTFEKLKSTCSKKTGPLCAGVLGISVGVCEIHQQIHQGDIQTDKIRLPELPSDAGPEEICSAMVEPHLQTRLRHHIMDNALYKTFKSKLSGYLAVNNTKNQCVERCSEPEVEDMDPDNFQEKDRIYLCKTALRGLQSLAAILGPTPEEERSLGGRPNDEQLSEKKEGIEGGNAAASGLISGQVKKSIEKLIKKSGISDSVNQSDSLVELEKSVFKLAPDEDILAAEQPVSADQKLKDDKDEKNPTKSKIEDIGPAKAHVDSNMEAEGGDAKDSELVDVDLPVKNDKAPVKASDKEASDVEQKNNDAQDESSIQLNVTEEKEKK